MMDLGAGIDFASGDEDPAETSAPSSGRRPSARDDDREPARGGVSDPLACAKVSFDGPGGVESVVVYTTSPPDTANVVSTDAVMREAERNLEAFIRAVGGTYDSEVAEESLAVLVRGCVYTEHLRALVAAIKSAERMTRDAEKRERRERRHLSSENETLRGAMATTICGASNAVVFGSCFAFGCGIMFGARAAGFPIATPVLMFVLGLLSSKLR